MPLHLIKLAVGVEDLDHLVAVQHRLAHPFGEEEGRIAAAGAPDAAAPVGRHWTLQTPKRAAEVVDGGSIYWVIKGVIRARNPIVAIEQRLRPNEYNDGRPVKKCAIVYAPGPIEVTPRPRRPHQGWRYLDPADAPPDLGGPGARIDPEMPEDMKAELAELGLL